MVMVAEPLLRSYRMNGRRRLTVQHSKVDLFDNSQGYVGPDCWWDVPGGLPVGGNRYPCSECLIRGLASDSLLATV